MDYYDDKVECPDCHGECVVHYDHNGQDWPEQCWTCGGSGVVSLTYVVRLRKEQQGGNVHTEDA